MAKPYPLTVDTRVDVAREGDGRTISQRDGSTPACCGGRSAGYYAQQAEQADHGRAAAEGARDVPMDFRIAMGVRRSDQEWKRKLNRLIAENQAAIDKMLADYGVPLLDEQGNLIAP